MTNKSMVAGLLTGLTLALGLPGGAMAQNKEYSFVTYINPGAPHSDALAWTFEEISKRTDGRITIKPYWSGSLLAAPDILGGVADGRADFGFTWPSYTPAELPLSQLTSIPFATSDIRALSGAMTALYAKNADYKAEWDRTGVMPLSFVAVAPSIVSGKEPITGLDWIKGRSIRSVGYHAVAVEAAGGKPVGIVVGELYEAIQRGLVSGYTSMIFDAIPSLSLQEVAPFVAETGLGTYGLNSMIVNPGAWQGMSEGDRTIVQAAIDEFPKQYFDRLAAAEDAACAKIIAAGGKVTVWSKSEIDAWKALVGDKPYQAWLANAGKASPNAAAVFTAFQSELSALGANEAPSGAARCAQR